MAPNPITGTSIAISSIADCQIAVVMNANTGEMTAATGGRDWSAWANVLGAGLLFIQNNTGVSSRFVLYRKGNTGEVRGTGRPYFANASPTTWYGYSGSIVSVAPPNTLASVSANASAIYSATGASGPENSQYNMLVVEQVTPTLPKWGMMLVLLSDIISDRKPNVMLMAVACDSHLYH
jgi:hypothetical protein